VFRPLEAVDLPETTEVVFEPGLVPAAHTARSACRVLAVRAQRFDSGENYVAPTRRQGKYLRSDCGTITAPLKS
jgi:hypothetical protein